MKLELVLAGLMQAYADGPQPFTNRRTADHPTSSAIYGMIERAMGIKKIDGVRDDTFKAPNGKVYHIEEDVYIHQDEILDETLDYAKQCQILTDDQIVGSLTNTETFICADGTKKETLARIKKEYLVNSKYRVTIEGDDELIQYVKEYLQHPIYPIYLGRYCCIPSEPIIQES